MSTNTEHIKRLFDGHYIAHEFETWYLTSIHLGKKDRLFLKADDEQIIFNHKAGRSVTFIVFGGGGLLWLVLPFLLASPTEGETIFFVVTFVLFSLLPCLWVLPRSHKVFTFDRMAGTVTLPNPKTFKNYGRNPGTITFNFTDAKFDMFLMQAGRPRRLAIRYPDRLRSLACHFLGTFDALQTYSFMVWYMDKNRPLPPGELLDPYREKDYERRKAEGFPDPLYPASIATPESTPEREKERIKRETAYWQKIEHELEIFKQKDPKAFDEFAQGLGKIRPNALSEIFRKKNREYKWKV